MGGTQTSTRWMECPATDKTQGMVTFAFCLNLLGTTASSVLSLEGFLLATSLPFQYFSIFELYFAQFDSSLDPILPP